MKVEVKVGGRGGSAGVAVARWRGRAVCVRVDRDPQPECMYVWQGRHSTTHFLRCLYLTKGRRSRTVVVVLRSSSSAISSSNFLPNFMIGSDWINQPKTRVRVTAEGGGEGEGEEYRTCW